MKIKNEVYSKEGTLDGLYYIEDTKDNREKPWSVYWQEHGVKYDIENFETEEEVLKCVEYRRLQGK